ncbi:MAG: outer membrane protein transport protein [Desulfobulbaceae bacterium]|nr:outer membrane protein transport protein [Desulfobulbaceae bacterium]HIJ91682.1 porin [Deltaproteobacteria bacterium]
MKKKIAVVALTGILAAGPAFASGYRIPEQSLNSTALSGAYAANTPAADASYYNPANMSWLDNTWQTEASLTWIHLSSVEYKDNTLASRNSGSRSEDFAMPNLHVVSPEYNQFRFGLSVVYPYGLSKRWDSAFPKTTAEEFTLKTYELNPTVSYKINNKLSIGGGVRAIYAAGVVKSNGTIPLPAPFNVTTISRDMDGDTTEYGYNLALTYRPIENLSLAATYRSKIDLDIEGDARLTSSINGASYSGGTSVSVPAPAVLTLATAYTCNSSKTTVEFTYDKTFWNAYDKLDFNYSANIVDALGVLQAAFDNPKAKSWSNSEAYRIGLTHKCTDRLTTMIGFAIDKTSVPDQTLGFELPDSDAKIYSLGARYQCSENLLLGLAYLYDEKESRTLTNAGGINGTFDNSAAQLVTAGLQYRF